MTRARPDTERFERSTQAARLANDEETRARDLKTARLRELRIANAESLAASQPEKSSKPAKRGGAKRAMT